MINEKSLWSKDFARNLGYENNHYKDYMKIINSCKFCCKCTFLPFLFFHKNQKQESNFQQVGGLVTRNSFAFCLQRVVLYFKGMPNSIHFYKRIFLHVIPVRITVSIIKIIWILPNVSLIFICSKRFMLIVNG